MIVRNRDLVMLGPVVTAAMLLHATETTIQLEIEQTGLTDTKMNSLQAMRMCLKELLALLDDYAVLYDEINANQDPQEDFPE